MRTVNQEVIDLATTELTYLPSAEQRRAKSSFWSRFNDNPICDPSEISLAIALRFVADGRLSRWWSQDGFKEWFRNGEEFRHRVEYLAHLALDALENVLIDPKAQGSARVNAAKLLMEVARKMPARGAVEKYLDEKIAEMDKKQLEEFISKRTKLLRTATEPTTDLPTSSAPTAE